MDPEMRRRVQMLQEREEIHSAKLKLLQSELIHVKTENDILLNQLSPRGQAGYREGSGMGLYDQDDHRSRGGSGMGHEPRDEQREYGSRMSDANNQTQVYNNDRHQTPDKQQPPYSTDKGQDWNDERSSSSRRGQNQFDQTNVKDDVKWNEGDNDKEDFDYEEMQRERRRKIYGCHDSTAINPQRYTPKRQYKKSPWFDHKTHPYPGGFLFLRFDDHGYKSAVDALKKQQSICRNAGGYLMGMARKDRIFVYENGLNVRNWYLSRDQPYRDVMTTENAIAVFWFTSAQASESFFENTHRNQFREPCFPTSNGYEAFYVPLCCPPTKPLNTFFFLEFLDAHKYNTEDMTQFEAEVRRDMSRVCPNCDPMDVSSQAGRVVYKPGPLISQRSKLFISRFESQRDTDQIWKLGMIPALRQKYGLTGAINAFSITIDIVT